MERKFKSSESRLRYIYPIAFITILILTFITYKNALHTAFNLDDSFILKSLPSELSFSACFSVFGDAYNRIDYRPIVIFSYALEQFFLGKIDPYYSHVINIILFSISGFLIFTLAFQLAEKKKLLFAAICCSLFITHPIYANIVNSIKNRDAILSLLFGLTFIILILQFSKRKNILFLLLAVVALTIGMLSKKDAIIAVPIFIIILVIKNRSFSFKPIIVAALVIIISSITIGIIKDKFYVDIKSIPQSEAVLATENPIQESTPFSHQLSLSVSTVFQYLKFVVVPKNHYFYYGYNMVKIKPLFSFIVVLKFVLLLGLIILAFYFSNKLSLLSIGIFIFFVALIPFANLFLPVGGILAPRYASYATVGFCFAIAATIVSIINYANSTMPSQKANYFSYSIAVIYTGIILFLYVPNTWARSNDWKNIYTLLAADMPHLKDSYEANRIASTKYLEYVLENPQLSNEQQKKFYESGLKYALQANALNDEQLYVNESVGIAYYGLGRIQEAEQQLFKNYIEFDTSMVSLELLGDIQFSKNNLDSASYFYEKFLSHEFDYNVVQRKLTNTLLKLGKADKAFEYNKSMMEKYPSSYIPYENMSYIYLYSGDTLKALDNYLVAFQYGLDDPQMASIVRSFYLEYEDFEKAKMMEKFLR